MPTFGAGQPLLRATDIDRALACYGKLGFETVYGNEDGHLVVGKDECVQKQHTVGASMLLDDLAHCGSSPRARSASTIRGTLFWPPRRPRDFIQS